MDEFEIFWNDLTEECQKELAKFLNLKEGDNNNYDVFPVATLYVERCELYN